MKPSTILATFAIATACASPQSTEYHDGPMVRPAPIRPVPGYTPPGTGLPEYMPTPQPRQYPRSPYKRYLPPEKDGKPGIWASSDPGATPEPGVLLGYYLPRPDVDDPDKDDLPVRCAEKMQKAHDVAVAKRGSQFTNDRRLKRCIASDLYLWCVDLYPHRDHRLYDATRAAANDVVSKWCLGLDSNPSRDTSVRRITDEAAAISAEGGR